MLPIITRENFKSIVKKQLVSLRNRGVVVKSSDVLESLSSGLGFENFATLNAQFKFIARRKVISMPFLSATANLFVISWQDNDATPNLDPELCVFPFGTQLSDVQAAENIYDSEFQDSKRFLPPGFDFSTNTVVLENLSMVPDVSKYGLPDSAHQGTVTSFIEEWTRYRVPASGVDTDFYDFGDDTSGSDYLLVWLSDEDAAIARGLFN